MRDPISISRGSITMADCGLLVCWVLLDGRRSMLREGPSPLRAIAISIDSDGPFGALGAVECGWAVCCCVSSQGGGRDAGEEERLCICFGLSRYKPSSPANTDVYGELGGAGEGGGNVGGCEDP